MHANRERRRLPRVETTIRVEVLDNGDWLMAHDISLQGMFATTRQPRWPGQLVRVRFCLPGEHRAIRATCRVVQLSEVPCGVGVSLSFLRLPAEALLQLHRYLDQRPTEVSAEDPPRRRAQQWVRRIIEDCAELEALARL